MKATLRRNGLLMFTVKVEFNVGRENIIDVVRARLLYEEPVPHTRRGIIALVKKAAHTHGFYLTFDATETEDAGPEKEDWERATAEAEKIVDEVFPELKPKE